jgi:16S rRNA (guanine527-N7)-methyltransferase
VTALNAETSALIRHLAAGLEAAQQERLINYVELLLSYSQVLDLTALRSPQELARELALEPFELLKLGGLPPADCVDLGSGNGSPVIPLAIAHPNIRFTAVESKGRRATFLSIAKTLLGLDNLALAACRTETLIESGAKFGLVTGRAYAPPAQYLADALQLLAADGEIRGFTGEDIAAVEAAAAALGLRLEQAHAYAGRSGGRHAYRLRRGAPPDLCLPAAPGPG